MNIFYLARDPRTASYFHVDKHITKMPIEATQMLCTVARERCHMDIGYKSAFINHVCTTWVGDCWENFQWTMMYASALLEEYTHRYGGIHKTSLVLDDIYMRTNHLKQILPRKELTAPPKTVNRAYKHLEPVMAHRAQYFWVKKRLHNWTGRRIPFWIEDPPYEIRDAGPPIHN